MCSFILLFLILTVSFDFIFQSSPRIDILEKEVTPTPSICKAFLVSTSEEDCSPQQTCTFAFEAYSFQPSFQGLPFHLPNQPSHGGSRRELPLALPPMLEAEQEDTCDMPELPCSLEFWRKAQYRAEESQCGKLQRWRVGRLEQLGRQSKMVFKVTQPTSVRPRTRSDGPDSPSACKRQGQRPKRQRRKVWRERCSSRNNVSISGAACSWIRCMAADGFHRVRATIYQCCQSFPALWFGRWSAGNGSRFEASLSRCSQKARRRPDPPRQSRQGGGQIRPQEPATSRQTFGPFKETPQEEVNDQKKAHRAMWLKHITEGIQVWERQLEEYRRHQAMLTDLARRATTEISSTSRAIQLLGAAGTGTALPSIPAPEAAETLEQGDESADQEEDQLRQKLQAILRSCASSLGVNPEGGVPPLDTKPEAESMEDGKSEEKTSKRPRSLEPFGGASRSS